MTHPEFAELQSLLDALCEESILPDQVRRLEELVLTYPEAEAHYVQYMGQYADLGRHFAGVTGVTQSLWARLGAAGQKVDGEKARQPQVLRSRHFLIWGSVGLSGLVAGLLLAVGLWPRPHAVRERAEQEELVDDTVAVLLQASGADWGKTDLPTRVGAPLPPGVLRLKSGFAHIEFYSGATVILEGPAEFQLLSRTKAYCARGKLRATVPPQAQGFTIGSPRLDLVDRGTEFGLEVGAGDKTEVHVFQGKVELYDAGADQKAPARKELTTGQGVRLEKAGEVRPIELNSAAFLTAKELAARSLAETKRREHDWLRASDVLRRNARLEVYYRFHGERPWERTLRDYSRHGRDGAIVGCSWGTGRWPGKQALEFKQVSDRVRFHVPGEFDSITLMAWVRVDGLPILNNSLMMADGWEEGELHWQLGGDGTIILGVQSRPKGFGAHYHALRAITPDRFGHWLHLAVVYDGDGGQVTHYIDGRPVAQEPIQFDIPLRIGAAQLGNWNIATHRNKTPVRYLTGCMDEFMLFSRPFNDREVEQLYTQGRPPL